MSLMSYRAEATEKELHRKFAADRIRGEWFRKSKAMLVHS
ncbi:MAG: hypothetical protein QOJ84_885 [Bradyrhizobium sp.]|nr:hypothetical protein [Bradyrhizobium sp.]